MATKKGISTQANDVEKVTYSSLIEQAITDFDSIFTKLVEKGSVYNGEQLVAGDIDQGIATSEYAGIIENNLFKVEGKLSSDITNKVNGMIPNYDKTGINATVTPTFTAGATTATITVSELEEGFYGSSSRITGSIDLTTVSFSGSTHADNTGNYTVDGSDAGKYVITPVKLISSVEIAKGSLAIDMDKANKTGTISSVIEKTAIGTGSVSGASILDAATAPTGRFVAVEVTPATDGTVTVASGVTFKAGYIDKMTGDTSVSTVTGEGTGTAKTVNVKLNDAAVTIGELTGQVAVDSGSLLVATGSQEGYDVTASIGTLTVGDASITEGYIDSADQVTLPTKTDKITSKTIKIKKGSVSTDAATVTLNDITTTNLAKDGENYKATVYVGGKAEGQDLTTTIDPGYIPDSSATRTLTGSATVTVPVGSVTISNSSGTGLSVDGSGIYSESQGTDDYSITVSGSVSTTATVKPGLIKAASEVINPSAVDLSKTIYIKKAALNATSKITTAAVAGTSPDKDIPTDFNLFYDSLDSFPTGYKGDYYTVTATASANAKTQGYLSGETASATDVKYIPKATFEYVVANENDSSQNFIQVKTGGFIPSGVIANIAEITGTPDYANVPLSYSAVTLNETTGKYQVTVSKGAVNPGYISSTNGPLSNNVLNLDAGSVTIDESSKSCTITMGTTPELKEGKYAFTGSNTAHKISVTKTTGYISGGKVEENSTCTANLTLDKAVLEIPESSTVALGATSGTASVSSTATKYTIRPVINNGNVSVTVGTAGYLAASDSQSVSISSKGDEVVYIKEGAVGAVSGNDASDTSEAGKLTGAANTDHSYTVSLSSFDINVSGQISEGYVSAGTASGKATVSARQLKINAGKATVTSASKNVALTTNNENVEIVTPDSTTGYLEIKAAGTVITNATVSKGYLDDASQVSHANIDVGATGYIKINDNTSATVGSNAEEAPELAATSGTTITCKGTVNTSDITVSVGKHTMGSAVYDELTRLKNRLAGTLANS